MRILSLALCALVFSVTPHAQTISISPEIAVLDREATLYFDQPVDTLFVTYRPNSVVAQHDTVYIGGFDSVRWTPKRAGVVRLLTPGGAGQNVSVRFTETPLSGFIILVGAGLILFGGALLSMRALLSGGPPRLEPEELPDT